MLDYFKMKNQLRIQRFITQTIETVTKKAGNKTAGFKLTTKTNYQKYFTSSCRMEESSLLARLLAPNRNSLLLSHSSPRISFTKV